jgi:hypothetical protein
MNGFVICTPSAMAAVTLPNPPAQSAKSGIGLMIAAGVATVLLIALYLRHQKGMSEERTAKKMNK